jgi:RNA 2',3'-cyclic 3'-phosphodiesterase
VLRAFISVDLPEEGREACAREMEALRTLLGPLLENALRFTSPQLLHLTLKFLGDTAEEQVPGLEKALAAAGSGIPPFEVVVKGLEGFPSLARPRTVYLGVPEGGRQLSALAARIEEQVAPLGFPTDARGFTPHLTLARVKRQAARLGTALATRKPKELARFTVTTVRLMQSRQTGQGVVHTSIADLPLG